VGLFPDVGGSWLLNRVPDGAGRFLALTGAMLSPADAIHAGLADVQLPEASRADVLEALERTEWSASSKEAGAQLDAVLASFALTPEPGPLQRHAAAIAAACEGEVLEDIVAAISAMPSADEPWLATAQATMAAGAPGSLRLGFELQRRAEGMSLAEVFRMEYVVALHCAAHGDFAEGIRALLIDKDRTPRWNPAELARADGEWAATFLREPDWPGGTHPLADLVDTH
ncbi:MAG: enoyl-CoA hydratase/isomerase family protein, partial [Lysobacteraceae bacterium]